MKAQILVSFKSYKEDTLNKRSEENDNAFTELQTGVRNRAISIYS